MSTDYCVSSPWDSYSYSVRFQINIKDIFSTSQNGTLEIETETCEKVQETVHVLRQM
jgi:hypothetical protein